MILLSVRLHALTDDGCCTIVDCVDTPWSWA